MFVFYYKRLPLTRFWLHDRIDCFLSHWKDTSYEIKKGSEVNFRSLRAIDETRTRDLHLGKVAYYQLYYYRATTILNHRSKPLSMAFYIFSKHFSSYRKAIPIRPSSYPPQRGRLRQNFLLHKKAGDGNRTRISSLGSWCSATELRLLKTQLRQIKRFP